MLAVETGEAAEGAEPFGIVFIDGDGGHDVVGQPRVAGSIALPAGAVEGAHAGVGGNPFAVGAVDGDVEHEVAQQLAVVGREFLPVVAVEGDNAAQRDTNPHHAVLVDHHLLDELHFKAAGDIVVLGPPRAVPFDDTVVVGADPEDAAGINHQAVDRLVFEFFVEHGEVGPRRAFEAAKALVGAGPYAVFVGGEGRDVVAADVAVAGVVGCPCAVALSL